MHAVNKMDHLCLSPQGPTSTTALARICPPIRLTLRRSTSATSIHTAHAVRPLTEPHRRRRVCTHAFPGFPPFPTHGTRLARRTQRTTLTSPRLPGLDRGPLPDVEPRQNRLGYLRQGIRHRPALARDDEGQSLQLADRSPIGRIAVLCNSLSEISTVRADY
jgi:hypothetical protein